MFAHKQSVKLFVGGSGLACSTTQEMGQHDIFLHAIILWSHYTDLVLSLFKPLDVPSLVANFATSARLVVINCLQWAVSSWGVRWELCTSLFCYLNFVGSEASFCYAVVINAPIPLSSVAASSPDASYVSFTTISWPNIMTCNSASYTACCVHIYMYICMSTSTLSHYIHYQHL